jgi:P4 family phage/plasmid primase-like protien
LKKIQLCIPKPKPHRRHGKRYSPAKVQALRLCAKGFAIVPLKAKSKDPLPGYSSSNYVTDVGELRALFQANPNMNYGVVTGAVSKVVVIDVDGKTGIGTFKSLKKDFPGFKPTVTVRTGKGYHYYCGYDPDIRTSRSKIGPKFDVSSDGAYVVGPGSIHPNGSVYAYFKGREIGTYQIVESKWLKTIVLQAVRQKPKHVAEALGESEPTQVAEGGRNATLTSYSGALVRKGVNSDDLLVLARKRNSEFEPPLDDAEVVKIVQSVSRYSAVDKEADPGEAYCQLVLETQFEGGKNLLFAEDGNFWRFNDKYWVLMSSTALESIILEIIQKRNDRLKIATATLIKQVVALLRPKVSAQDNDPLRFKSSPLSVLNLRNGELLLKPDGSVELMPHRAESFLRHYLDIEYVPLATSPLLDKALQDIFPGPSSDVIPYFYEVLGYILQPERPIPMVMIWQGIGSNGKSALAGLLAHMLGPDAVAAMNVSNLGRNQFSMNALFGRLLFLDDDVPTGTRLPDGELKKISEEKLVTAERKFGDVYNFVNRAFPLMLCNNPPTIIDVTEGMQRRLHVVPFTTHFSEEQQDRTLFNRIKANELSGVLNHAISGYARIVEAGWRLNRPQVVRQATARFLIDANPIPAFLDEITKPGGKVLAADLFARYLAWCQQQGITMTQQRMSFQRNVEALQGKAVKSNRGMTFSGIHLPDA